MRFLTLFILVALPFAAMGVPPPKAVRATNQVILSRTNYDAAEAIFRRFLADAEPGKTDTNVVRLLSYGPTDSDLPVELLARFRTYSVLVTNASAGEIREVKRQGRSERVLAERKGTREGLAIALRSLTTTKDGVEATVVSVSSGITIVNWTVRLRKDGATWKVTEKIRRSIACFG